MSKFGEALKSIVFKIGGFTISSISRSSFSRPLPWVRPDSGRTALAWSGLLSIDACAQIRLYASPWPSLKYLSGLVKEDRLIV